MALESTEKVKSDEIHLNPIHACTIKQKRTDVSRFFFVASLYNAYQSTLRKLVNYLDYYLCARQAPTVSALHGRGHGTIAGC